MTTVNLTTLNQDFARPLWCLLGLPFDAVNMQQTAQLIQQTIEQNIPCFLSTPNLNFLCTAQGDKSFRQSVINSELSIVDGFPIILIAKLLQIPLPERVAGSDLIDYLYQLNNNKPVKVFFFGGTESAGGLACEKINRTQAGIQAVGYYSPGFGSINEMSSEIILNQINQAKPDFLIVALGAKKGQTWIEKNRHQLNAPVISHLGAVINFYAGSIKRAPILWQRLGLEWLWRIYQEPNLWQRYYHDGIDFIKLCLFYVLPYHWWLITNQTLLKNTIPCEILIDKSLDITYVSLTGHCVNKTINALRNELKFLSLDKKDITIDLCKVEVIDGAFIGLIFILSKYLALSNNSAYLINPTAVVKAILIWNRVDYFIKK